MNPHGQRFAWLWLGMCLAGTMVARGEEVSSALPTKGQQLVEKLRNRNREIDPFGCAMNPAKKAALVIEAPPVPVEEVPASKRTSLELALQTLTVNGVNPGARTVLVGARRYRQGDHLVFQHEEVRLRLRVCDVALEAVTFSDLDTGEKAVHRLEIAPQLQRRGYAAHDSRQPDQPPSRIVSREP